jgi:PTH2 family peptidyl-tRNA hydrolase
MSSIYKVRIEQYHSGRVVGYRTIEVEASDVEQARGLGFQHIVIGHPWLSERVVLAHYAHDVNPKCKQVIVVRGDLSRLLKQRGKLAAQVSHAVLGSIFSQSFVQQHDSGDVKCINLTPDVESWFNHEFTKIVVKCTDEAHLLEIYNRVRDSDVMHALIKDAGHTMFTEPTYTCLGIGPANHVVIDELIGSKLPLL